MNPQTINTGYLYPAGVRIPASAVTLAGSLCLPASATGIVLFAQGRGSRHQESRNQTIAQIIQNAGIGTLIFDLLTPEEKMVDRQTCHLRVDIALLSHRLQDATEWVKSESATRNLQIGYLGITTGAAAAFKAAATMNTAVSAIVSRSGRPDLAGEEILKVKAPTLLIVGGCDELVLRLNVEEYDKLTCPKELAIIPGATHLFSEPGTIEEVAHLAAHWFHHYLQPGD